MKVNSSLHNEKQEAARLSCSPRHLANMRERGLIPYVKFGRLVRYRPADVDRALEKLTIRELA